METVREWVRKWRTPVACARCGGNTTWGAAHPRDHADPPAHALCWACWNGVPRSPADEAAGQKTTPDHA